MKFILLLCVLTTGCTVQSNEEKKYVATGARNLIEHHVEELEGKRLGLVMNPTARIDGIHVLDTLLTLGLDVTALFAPEHGFRGTAGAGEVIEDGVDQETGLPVYSLYGKNKRPTPEMLSGVDILLFDMQDVGARFYTYNVTMKYVIEAAAEAEKEVWILDRPNPAGGGYLAGWILQDPYYSFVGAYPVPMAHGLTLGELALMAKGEGWFDTSREPKIKVIKMDGWTRSMRWADTGLEWYPPSPNLPTFKHAYFYLGTVLFEGTNLSEGRGTDDPFLTLGSPFTYIPVEELSSLENKFGIQLDTLSFIPRSLPGKALNPKHQDRLCFGLKINTSGNFEQIPPLELGIELLNLSIQHSDSVEIKTFINKLAGINLADFIEEGKAIPSWEKDVANFRKQRKPYLLY